MIKVQEMYVKKPRTYLAHQTKLLLAKEDGAKDLNPAFFLPRGSAKQLENLEEALESLYLWFILLFILLDFSFIFSSNEICFYLIEPKLIFHFFYHQNSFHP